MERNHVLNVVIKHIKLNIDNLDKVEIDPTRSMASYGSSSLDTVEIVSGVMRELKIRVPRTKLANLGNINELVDLFLQTANSSMA